MKRVDELLTWLSMNVPAIKENNLIDKTYWKHLIEEEIKQSKRDMLISYTRKINEALLRKEFDFEHAKHGIACEIMNDVRNNFINENI